MRTAIAALCCLMFAAAPALAEQKTDATKKEPTAAQKKQQARMKGCSKEAADKELKGDARKKFMSACLKG